MKSRIKFIIEFILFLIIFIFIFNKATLLFVRKGDGFGSDILNFYKQEVNSIDVLVLGSSHAYTAFNPYVIEEETGFSAYDFATQEQPIWITYYYLIEALKYQSPKYVVLDVHMAVYQDSEYTSEQVNRTALDKMKLSLNKINAINESVHNEDKLSYYFNIIKYHTRYNSLTLEDYKTVFNGYTLDNKGFTFLPVNDFYLKKDWILINNDVEKIFEKNEIYLNKIIELCKKNNIELILVKTPIQYDWYSYSKLNYVINIAEENNIRFVNYIKDIEKLNLNYEIDFFDGGHLNYLGAKKLTLDFCNYLKS